MNLEEYKNMALQRLNKTILDNPRESMSYACMGLIEETGEIISELRKPLFKGNFHEKQLDLEELKSEIGDLMWYIALICKNCNIDMNELEKYNVNEKSIDLPKRESLIYIAINVGITTGEIVEEYLMISTDCIDKEELIRKLSKQCGNINQLADQLGLTIEEILEKNIMKINSRYNEKGEVIR